MRVDIKKLPTQGYFYDPEFKIDIKPATKEEIYDYKKDINLNDPLSIFEKIIQIIKNNTTISDGYDFNYIKGIDILWVFLQIVIYTKRGNIWIDYEDAIGNVKRTNFSSDDFIYFKFDNWNINKEEKCIDIKGWKLSMPSVGVERVLTNFLILKAINGESEFYKNCNYYFTFFLSDKSDINFDEIENLIKVFNDDLESSSITELGKIISYFNDSMYYRLYKDGVEIDLASRLNLEKIWDI